MSTRNWAGWIVAVVVALAGMPAARAGVVTFTFDGGDDDLATITKTVDGITLTLSNPSAGVFAADGDGIELGEGTINPGTASNTFNLAVTGGSLELTGYSIAWNRSLNSGTENFAMSGGTGSSTGNSTASNGSFTANGNWQLAPGQVGTLTMSGTNANSVSQLKTLTFNVVPAAAVPEPGTVGLALVGAGVLGVRAWRRRGVRAAA